MEFIKFTLITLFLLYNTDRHTEAAGGCGVTDYRYQNGNSRNGNIVPVFSSVATTYDVREDTLVETFISSINVTDPDGDVIIACTHNGDNGEFDIRQNSTDPNLFDVYLLSGVNIDYNVTPSFELKITCTDFNSESATQNITIDVIPNQAPLITDPGQPFTLSENTLTQTALLTLNVSDVENDVYFCDIQQVNPSSTYFDVWWDGTVGEKRLWTKEDIEAKINELIQLTKKQEELMKRQETQYNDNKRTIADTDELIEDEIQEQSRLRMDTEEVEDLMKERKQQLDVTIAGYESEKVCTEMESKVAEDLRRQIRRLKMRFERLEKKDKVNVYDKELLDEYDEHKRRVEEVQGDHDRLSQKVSWYASELIKFKTCLNKSEAPALHEITNNRFNRTDSIDEIGTEYASAKDKCAKLPPINVQNINSSDTVSANAGNKDSPRPDNHIPRHGLSNTIPHTGNDVLPPIGDRSNDMTAVGDNSWLHPTIKSFNSVPATNELSHLPNILANGTTAANILPHPPKRPTNGSTASNKLPHLPSQSANDKTSTKMIPHPPSKPSSGKPKANRIQRQPSKPSSGKPTANNLPHPPSKTSNGTRKYTRKFNNDVT